MKKVIKNGIILTMGENARVLYDHDLWYDESGITGIQPKRANYDDNCEIIDAKGMVVMPGMINAHMHFYSTLIRGFGKLKPSGNFLEVLENVWWKLDKNLTLEDDYYSTITMLLTAIRKGTTTIIDHHASPGYVPGSLFRVADAVKQSGLRASLCYEISDRDGATIAEEGIAENAAWMEYCQKNANPYLRGLMGLHASFTISDTTMIKAVETAKKYNGGCHIHTAEDSSDQVDSLAKYNKRVVERLYDLGVLGPQTITAHCVHADEKELDLLKRTDSMLVHNPQSNMNNAVGIADLKAWGEHELLFGLGSDAMTVNMFEELRVALWAQHIKQRNPNACFMEVVQSLFINNAKIANRYWDNKLGELAVGKAADIILLPYVAPTPLNDETMWGHLLFGISQSVVDTTIVNGRTLMHRQRILLDLNEQEINSKATECAERIWKKL